MRKPKKKSDHSRDALVIDTAYGLVQGAFGNGNMWSDAGHDEWNKPEVQEAAKSAARTFLAQIGK